MEFIERQNKVFLDAYNSLNKQQQLAVDTIEGPVMVIAGPGTGKTQILSARIGKILRETDVMPQNILCLTYTDAGAIAMRKRLQSFIGPDAYKVNIYTFHAFCNDVIQENLYRFQKNTLDPISDLEKIQLFKQLIDGFGANHPLKRFTGDVYYDRENLVSLFSTMKKEGWTAGFLSKKIDEYLDSLPLRDEFIYKVSGKGYKKGDIKTKKLEECKEKMERLRAAINEFDNFQLLMQQANRYDFDDMINWVIKAFETDANLLANYQERFQYILVDEYQDTSGTQNRLVELLINFWDKPNIFVVGDDDQSIYRFQGANIENMQAFQQNFKEDLLTIVLKDNYRSTQPILDVAKNLIDRNNERLVKKMEGLTKDLVSANAKYKDMVAQVPVITSYETPSEEFVGITLQVRQLLDNGVMPGDIAVIYKENKYGEELARYFQKKDIPVYSKRSINLFDIPLAQNIITLLRYLVAEHQKPFSGDALLFEILHYNWFGIPPIEIAKLCYESAETQYSANRKSIRELLYSKANTPAKDLFTEPTDIQLQKASAAIEKLIGQVGNLTLQMLFQHLISDAGVLKTVMSNPEKHWQLKVLTALFDFVKEETHRKPSLNLQGLVEILDLMKKEGLCLPLTQVSGTDKGVNLLTAHGAKGLEYEYVFFAGCNACFWEKKKKPGGGFALPDTVFSSSFQPNDDEELRRLFYVALTRSQQHLHISFTRFKQDGKEEEPSMFIAEIRESQDITPVAAVIDQAAKDEFAALQFEVLQPEMARLEEDFITRLLDKFVMNVTALNSYIECPLRFYYNNLLHIPSAKNANMTFGSAVHEALEKLFKEMLFSGKFPDDDWLVECFGSFMKRNRECFTDEEFSNRMHYGETVLREYYKKNVEIFNTNVKVEEFFKNVVVKGVPLKGKLDKLEFDGRFVNVVDYKTGKFDNAKEKLKAPNEKQPEGGDYWRQAVFYKILVDNCNRGWQVVSTEFDFVEPAKDKSFNKAKVTIGAEDITTVTQQIVDVWQKIQNRDFYTGCGKKECEWCQFVKHNDLAIALHALAEEEEEETYLQTE